MDDTSFSISSIDISSIDISSIDISSIDISDISTVDFIDAFDYTNEAFDIDDDSTTIGNWYLEPFSENNEIRTITYDDDDCFYPFNQSFFSLDGEFFV